MLALKEYYFNQKVYKKKSNGEEARSGKKFRKQLLLATVDDIKVFTDGIANSNEKKEPFSPYVKASVACALLDSGDAKIIEREVEWALQPVAGNEKRANHGSSSGRGVQWGGKAQP